MALLNSASLAILFLCSLISLQYSSKTIANATALGNETDRLALLKLKASISGDPYGILSSWNDFAHFCEWPGISCAARHLRLTALDLEGYGLRGTISPFVGNLSFLRLINLRNNSLSGEIPPQVGHLPRLRSLNLSFNMLEGEIPENLSRCSQLEIISIAFNKLAGAVPAKLGSLEKLVHLNLESNNLTGGVPPSLGNVSSLEVLSLSYNYLVGTIPDELGRLKRLSFFGVGANSLSGTIPPSLFNMSFISTFLVASNKFKGTIPPTIGLTLPRLQNFLITLNEFSGTIPGSLSNATQLQMLDMGQNTFSGEVPSNFFANLPDLWKINLGYNYLGNYSANSLDFFASLTNCTAAKILSLSSNRFVGVLPKSVANLSMNLSNLYLGGNELSGNIPAALENLANLVILGTEYNRFTGVIPASLGKLRNLQILSLASNELSGEIPSSIGNLTKVFNLELSNNKLEGRIPLEIANLKRLQVMNIASNRLNGLIPREIFGLSSLLQLRLAANALNGTMPTEVGKLANIVVLDLSENNLTSEIPDAIRECQSMEYLDLHGNSFQGALPSALASLRGLQYVDLSRNNLTGKIPNDLENLRFLLYLNLSFNNLEGEVPEKGVFENTSATSVVGNSKLCGGVASLQLPRCPNGETKQSKTQSLKLIVAIVCVATFLLLFLGFIFFYWRRNSKKKSSITLSRIDLLPNISYKTLYKATNGFSSATLIGTGSFGSVYKGVLDQEGSPVAVKVLNLQKKGAEKSFIAECNALRTMRHRNLVKVLTCCSSMDYNGNEFKALVFEYMCHGSLEERLHLGTGEEENHSLPGLSLNQRLNIAIDVASAIHYLHEECDQSIIHCDLKPSNVLLDSEMIARVSDFGLARLISNAAEFSGGQTSTVGIKGTIGYVAPEYATGSEPSKDGDIYSYGILVLETFTGRRPTDEMFKDDFNLRNFVMTALPERPVQIADSALLTAGSEETAVTREEDGAKGVVEGGVEIRDEEQNTKFESTKPIDAHLRACLVSIFEVGLSCSRESPSERMKIGDVLKELENIRNVYRR